MKWKTYLEKQAICHLNKAINYQKELCTRRLSNLIQGLVGQPQTKHKRYKAEYPLSKMRRVQN